MTRNAREVVGQAQRLLKRELGFAPAQADIRLYEYGGKTEEIGRTKFFFADYIWFRVKGGAYEYRYSKGAFEVSKIEE